MFFKHRVLIFVIAFVGLNPLNSHAFLTQYFSYPMLTERADLIVIAAPFNRQELDLRAVLPGHSSVGRDGERSVPAVEIETKFKVLVVLKGNLKIKDEGFTLVHYRLKEPPRHALDLMLIDFDLANRKSFLMFLKERKDGRMEAYQEDKPGWCIEMLAHPYLYTP